MHKQFGKGRNIETVHQKSLIQLQITKHDCATGSKPA